MNFFRKIPPGRIIAAGFLLVILTGSLLLSLPIAQTEGTRLSYLDALFTAASATCVTGLVTTTVSETFTLFGKSVIALLIQIGGLGVACMGACFVLLTRKHMDMKNRQLIREGWNVSSSGGLVKLLKLVLLATLIIESVGALLSTLIFAQYMPLGDAVFTGIFHSISAFNNAGFDVLGSTSLIPYQGNVALTLLTAVLIILGGIGFAVIYDVLEKRRFSALSLHSKMVLIFTAVLIVGGTAGLYLTSELGLLDSFFFSVSARTAGFATVDVGTLPQASVFIIIVLMFIGASPGGTGGGIKTTTFFTLLVVFSGLIRNRKRQIFHRKLPDEAVHKAFILSSLYLAITCTSTFLLTLTESTPFLDLLFEVTSAIATVGLTTGITGGLCAASKLILILTMYIGRLGPLTAATIWTAKRESSLSYSQENITIG